MENGDDSAGSREGDGAPADDSDDDGPPIMQMSPLDLRFSQRKTRSFFADGKVVEETAKQIQVVRRSPEDAQLYDAPWRLCAPFPAIEVIRWRCKLRDEATGRPVLDAAGKEVYEQEESWFTLDNRRLFCLQQAAVRLWPERCTADVRAEIRKDRRMREIRKFRTLDLGLSIMVGSVVDGVPFERWCWKAEVASAAKGAGPKGRGQGRDGKAASGKGRGGPGSGPREQKGKGGKANAQHPGKGDASAGGGEEQTPPAGKAGKAGKAGEAGKAGKAGNGGKAGKAGEACKAGKVGKAGKASEAGKAGKTAKAGKAGDEGDARPKGKGKGGGKGKAARGPPEAGQPETSGGGQVA